jgi:hypothetical protein
MTDDAARFQQVLALAQARSAIGDWASAAELWHHVVTANPVQGSYRAELAEARFQLANYQSAAHAYAECSTLRAPCGTRPPGVSGRDSVPDPG